MSFFDAFTPEGMLKAMGVNPQEMLAEYARWKGEFDGMKTGAVQASQHFNNRLNTIEQNQIVLNAKLDAITKLLLQVHLSIIPPEEHTKNGHAQLGSSNIGHG